MKIQDMNQTQVIDMKSAQSTKKNDNLVCPMISALSTSSLNTGSLPTTSHQNTTKMSRKLLTSKKPTAKHRKKPSHQQDQIETMIRFQADLIQRKMMGDNFKSGAIAQGRAHRSKHKSNTTLSNYLKSGKVIDAKKEKSSLDSSYMGVRKSLNTTMLMGETQPRCTEAFLFHHEAYKTSGSSKGGQKVGQEVPSSFINTFMDLEGKLNPYKQVKKSSQMSKEIQNKTQPIPRHILEMAAHAEVVNLSTGTSIIQRALPIRTNNKSQSKNAKPRDPPPAMLHEDPAKIYNNKKTVILDDLTDLEPENSDGNQESQSKLDNYTLGKQLGQGAYAVVRVASSKKDGTKYAIKIYDKSKLSDTNRQRSVRREIKLLQKMNHKNIVKIYEAFETEHHVYLVMEYVRGPSLHGYLKEKQGRKLEEEDAKFIFRQILTALQYCHRKSIAHRDIKLENILLDENKNVKLIDFGFSTCIPNDKKIKMFCGTPSYMAPEIVMKEEYAGPPADIWASGVLLYALMNGCFPFRGQTDKELYKRIQRGTFTMHNPNASSLLVEFLEKMINTKADERTTADKLLQHKWFQVDSSQGERDNADSTAQTITEQKKMFKAKILSNIPIEKSNNNIRLIPQKDKVPLKFTVQNLNMTQQGVTYFRPNPTSAQQNINLSDSSDYGISQPNIQRKLNQEAYQAYYNTSNNCNYGLTQTPIQNPYFNNFFTTPGGGVHNVTQGNNPSQGIKSPTKPHLNIQTNGPQLSFPVNFAQQQVNHVGTPQVFNQTQQVPVSNNWFIKHVDAFINVYNSPPPQEAQIVVNRNYEQNPMNAQQEQRECPDNNQNKEDDDDDDSYTEEGFNDSHIVNKIPNHYVYGRLKDAQMSKTQYMPVSVQCDDI